MPPKIKPPKELQIRFDVFRGEATDPPKETGGLVFPEFSNLDFSPPAPSGRGQAVTADGYEMMTFVPTQSNPDGAASDASANTSSLMAYTFPRVNGVIFSSVNNGSTGASTNNNKTGQIEYVFQAQYDGQSFIPGSQNVKEALPPLQDVLVYGGGSTTRTLYAVDKDSLVSTAVSSGSPTSGVYLIVLCGQKAGQFNEGCQFFVYRPSLPSVNIQFGKFQDGAVSTVGSQLVEGYAGEIGFCGWFHDENGNGIWTANNNFRARPTYHVTPNGVTAYTYDTVSDPGDARLGRSIAPVAGSSSSLIIASGLTAGGNTFEQVAINTPVGKFSTIEYNEGVFFPAANTIPGPGIPSGFTNYTLYLTEQMKSLTLGPDGYYYFVATPPYITGLADDQPVFCFPRTNLYKVGFQFVDGVLHSYTTQYPTVQFSPTTDGNLGSVLTIKDASGADTILRSTHMAILSDGSMCVSASTLLIFISPSYTQVATINFQQATYPRQQPLGVCSWASGTKFLVTGYRYRVDGGGFLVTDAWEAIYSSSGVLESEAFTQGAGGSCGAGAFDPLGQNGVA